MEKKSLTALARTQLQIAGGASSGRSATTVYGGHEHVLRQTVIALNAGFVLDEHENPGEATVHVLRAGSGCSRRGLLGGFRRRSAHRAAGPALA